LLPIQIGNGWRTIATAPVVQIKDEITMMMEKNMRLILAAALVAMTMGSIEAEADGSYWKCVGEHYVCGSTKKAVYQAGRSKNRSYTKKSYKKKNYARKSYKTKSHKKIAYVKRNYKKRYGGRGTYYGKASYYWRGQRVASGGRFNPNAMTAAHKTLPFGTRVRVTNRRNGRSVIVRINDRGPYVRGRIIDLSRAAAGRIGMRGAGVVPVSVTVLGRG